MREPNIYKVGDTYYLFTMGPRTRDISRAIRMRRMPVAYPPGQKQGSKNWERLGRNSNAASTTIRKAPKRATRTFGAHRAHGSGCITTGTRSIGTPTTWGGRSRPDRGRRRDAGRLLFGCLAKAETKGPKGIEGEWKQINREPGKKSRCFKGTNGTFPQGSPFGPRDRKPEMAGQKIRST